MVLSHIIHLSDLHIRNGDNTYSRYEEYKQVFKETVISIKSQIKDLNLSFEDFIIVITGDIFHNKNVIGNYGLIIYRKFIQALSLIGRTYIISGNHDYDQSDRNKPSLVYSSTFAISNVFVLNKSTSFVIDDIGVSFVSIDSTLDNYRNSGRIQDLPKFPDIIGNVKFKLALFHGTFSFAKLYNGKSIEENLNPYPLEWVSNFDYVLLGDIHKRQVFYYKNKTICGYAGSLIQQNFGEDIINHGYLIWDLYNKDIKKVNVYNNKGFINIKENENKDILIRINNKFEKSLEDYIYSNTEIFPKNIDIKSFSNINILNLDNILKKYSINYDIINIDNGSSELLASTRLSNFISSINEYSEDINVNNDVLTEYFKPLLSKENLIFLNNIIKNKELLLLDSNNYPIELREETNRINKELSAIINASLNSGDNSIVSVKSSFKIKYLEWEGLLCYENKNWLNMNELDRKLFMVKGKNGTGKSAIYDILLLAIWGENTKKNSLSSGVVNHNKSKGYTIVDIELDNKETYRIFRNYSKKNIGNKLLISCSVIYRYLNRDKGNDMEIIKKDTACNNEINRLFGDIENFLSTSMITQRIDCDILKMDFKAILELIDKSFNIEYIYHLYNIFNKTINKYKGLHKYIESKKEVYIRLLKSNNNDEEFEKLKEESDTLNNKIRILKDEYENNIKLINSFSVDSDIILKIDCNELKNKINCEKTVSETDYNNYKIRFSELEYILKGKDILNLSNKYDKSYEDVRYEYNSIESKPCDLSIIEKEGEYLKDYFNIFDNDIYSCFNDIDIENKINILKKDHDISENILRNLIGKKPNKTEKIDKPIKARKNCLNEIESIFGDLECLGNIINRTDKIHYTNDVYEDDTILSYKNYSIKLEYKEILEKTIGEIKSKIDACDILINKLFKNRENITEYSAPHKSLYLETNKFNNSKEIAKEIEGINYDNIIQFLKSNEKLLNDYNSKCVILKELEEDRDKYYEELTMLNNSEDYQYNPNCIYCCNRVWVKRIKEIEIIIKKYEDDINVIKMAIHNKEYKELLETAEQFNKDKDKYEILCELRNYLIYIEKRDEINNSIKKSLDNKKQFNKLLTENDTILKNTNNYINLYHNKAIDLWERINAIKIYEKYKKWEESYTEALKNSEEINRELAKYTNISEYNKSIKPRIISYRELLNKYNRWKEYDNKINIIYSKEYLNIKDIIDNYNNIELYKNYTKIVPIINRNIELKDIIVSCENDIRNKRDLLAEKIAIVNYNKEIHDNLNKLDKISLNIENTLSLLDTIIVNFQDFRINLYDKIILNKLLINTNKMLKNISHSDTKPFELDYIINVSRDIIHINWLIKNTSICNSNKQIISIHQASGYQQFVISLALRLCLFGNKTTCKQLFIDEGFVSFDKYNLSIVPNFLKSLLSYFDSIIIVSHIDLIQETIDDDECIAEINYNKSTSISSITYNQKV